MISTIFSKALNIAIDLNSDIDVSKLDGKSLGISIDELPQDICISVENNKFVSSEISESDVVISGNIAAFISMVTDDNGIDNDDLFINGRIGVAKSFQEVLSKLTLNWQELFEKVLPEDAAKNMAIAIKEGVLFLKENGQKIKLDISKVINSQIESSDILVKKSEFDELKSTISEINKRVDKLLDSK